MASTCILFLLVAITAATAISLPYHSETVINQFQEFVKKYNKKYDSEIEIAFRFGIFVKNLDYLDHLNKHSKHARFGITQFTDLTNEEFVRWNTGAMQPDFGDGCQPNSEVGDINITDSHFDWRDRGIVSPVRAQGQCGSCWAFSAIGNVEAINAIKTQNVASLSEQQLVDCDTSSNGCASGYVQNALAYILAKGSMSDADYPYMEQQGSCRYDESKVSVRISNCYLLTVSEDALAEKLQQFGPLSIAIDSTYIHGYQGGILQDEHCSGTTTNHAVLLVGFGEENGLKYWIIKNSWGAGWGEQGYFRMQRGVNCNLIANGPIVTAA